MPTQITNRIAEMRRARGITQERLARMLGVSRQQVSDWERGISIPLATTAIEIARALGTTVEALYPPMGI